MPRDQAGVVIQDVLGADPGTDALDEGDLVVEVNRQPTPDLATYRRRARGARARASRPGSTSTGRSRRSSFLTRIEVEERQ